MNPIIRAIALVGAALGLAACESQSKIRDPVYNGVGPFFHPHNFNGDARLSPAIRRVLLLPLHGGDSAPAEASEALDPVFATALETQMRFEVVTLSREECQKSYGVRDISSAAALPHDFLQSLGKKFGADAVLFVDVTAYQGYRPLLLGVRAKLASVDDHRLIWTFDEVFSAADPAVANAVRSYYTKNELNRMPVDLTPGALQSPSRFAAYAADAAFHTLPPR